MTAIRTPIPKPSVVIADDDDAFREGMAAIVREPDSGFELAGLVADGAAALDLVLRKGPSLLITDISMPVMDGIALVEELRRRGEDLRCVIISGQDDAAYARAAVRFGVREYLLKPLVPKDFRAFLAKMREELDRQAVSARALADLESRVRLALPAARERRIRELLVPGAGRDKERDRLLGIDLEASRYCAACLRFPRADERSLQAIAALADTVFGSRMRVFSAFESPDTMAIVLADTSADARRAYLAASTGAAALRAAVLDLTGAPVTLGLGCLKDDPGSIGVSWMEAREAAASAFSSEEGMFVAWGDLETPTGPDAEGPGAAGMDAVGQDDVLAAVRLGWPEAASEAATRFSDALGSGPRNEKRVKTRVVALLAALDLMVPEGTRRPEPPFRKAMDAPSRLDLADLLARYAAECADAMKASRSGRTAGLVERARIIAESRMSDEALSLDDVAAELFVSPSHLRHVFKRESGSSFGDFLSALRLDTANRLLADPGILIQEVARMVGYSEQRYFASCFKRRFGMTPTERRAGQAMPREIAHNEKALPEEGLVRSGRGD